MPLRRLIPLVIVCLLAATASAQGATQPKPTEIAPFSLMLGRWAGEGWTSTGPKKRISYRQTEVIAAKADGNVITVEGTGHDPKTKKVVFAAFATIAYNDQGKLRWTAYSGGNALSVAPKITDNTFIWGFAVEGGQVRYTITLTKMSWHEIGEFSPDGGKSWFPTLEMDLTKTP